jgi:hypothetical protein
MHMEMEGQGDDPQHQDVKQGIHPRPASGRQAARSQYGAVCLAEQEEKLALQIALLEG